MERKIFYIRPFFNNNKITSFFFKSHSKFVIVVKAYSKSFIVNHCYFITKNIFFFNYKTQILTNKRNILKQFLNFIYLHNKGINQGFYMKFKIIGLGFKIRRIFLENKKRFLKINLGYSHSIFYKLPKMINIFVKKKVFFLQSYDFNALMSLSKKLQTLRASNPYKEKGILLFSKIVKLKSGKQQQK